MGRGEDVQVGRTGSRVGQGGRTGSGVGTGGDVQVGRTGG